MNARRIALNILLDAIEKKDKSDFLLSRYTDHSYFYFINNIVDTTIKQLYLIDHIINTHTTQNLSKKKFLHYVLRCAICEIYFLKTPHHAIFYEWIKIVKNNKRFSDLAGVVNAILHKLIETYPSLEDFPITKSDLDRDKISIYYSLPAWIVDDMIETYGIEETVKIATYCNTVPNTTLRLNTDVLSSEKIKKHLSKSKVEFEDSPFDDVIYVKKFNKPIKKLIPFNEGLFYIQDEASINFIKSIVPLLSPESKILDASCGLGGKLSALHQFADKTHEIHAWDPNKNKISLCQENLTRLRIKTNFHLQSLAINKLANTTKNKYKNYFDYIFLDPPCSGFGSLRRKPQAKIIKDQAQIEELIALQKNIFTASLKLLKPGGLIFYSLCTMLPKETTQHIPTLLQTNEKLELQEFPKHDNKYLLDFIKDKKYFSPKAHELNTDYLFGTIFKYQI